MTRYASEPETPAKCKFVWNTSCVEGDVCSTLSGVLVPSYSVQGSGVRTASALQGMYPRFQIRFWVETAIIVSHTEYTRDSAGH